LKHWSWAKCD